MSEFIQRIGLPGQRPRAVRAMCRSALMITLVWIGTGCRASDRDGARQSAHDVFAVRIDRAEPAPAVAEPGVRLPRRLAFEVAGMAPKPAAGASQEDRAAVRQAAIIDAFCRALIEARRARGQSVSDFTAKLGPRLTVVHRTVGAGYEAEVRLLAGGVEKRFVVRDGVLQHLPHDFALVHRLFAETRGEFSLLPTADAVGARVEVARVGCYLPRGVREVLAGDLDAGAGPPASP